MTNVIRLIERWRDEAGEQQTRYRNDTAAHFLRLAAKELEDALRVSEDEVLNLTEAAAESGYSAAHLGRLVRAGLIPNAGRRNVPRVRRGDLPRKAAGLPEGTPQLHVVSAEQLARSIVNQSN